MALQLYLGPSLSLKTSRPAVHHAMPEVLWWLCYLRVAVNVTLLMVANADCNLHTCKLFALASCPGMVLKACVSDISLFAELPEGSRFSGVRKLIWIWACYVDKLPASGTYSG